MVNIVHLEFLVQHKEPIRAPDARQALDNLLLARVIPPITEFSPLPWIALSGHNGTHDSLCRSIADIADHVSQWQAHSRQRLLYQ
ncbi:MAG: hypothetical protein WA639_22135 [Candidatus Acidiferrum sp.]